MQQLQSNNNVDHLDYIESWYGEERAENLAIVREISTKKRKIGNRMDRIISKIMYVVCLISGATFLMSLLDMAAKVSLKILWLELMVTLYTAVLAVMLTPRRKKTIIERDYDKWVMNYGYFLLVILSLFNFVLIIGNIIINS